MCWCRGRRRAGRPAPPWVHGGLRHHGRQDAVHQEGVEPDGLLGPLLPHGRVLAALARRPHRHVRAADVAGGRGRQRRVQGDGKRQPHAVRGGHRQIPLRYAGEEACCWARRKPCGRNGGGTIVHQCCFVVCSAGAAAVVLLRQGPGHCRQPRVHPAQVLGGGVRPRLRRQRCLPPLHAAGRQEVGFACGKWKGC